MKVGSEKLQGNARNSMVAKIGETTSLTLKSSLTSSAKVEIWPVQTVVANATFDNDVTSALSLDTTGQFEMRPVDGSSTCKIPSRLDVECKEGYGNQGSSCKQQTRLNMKLVIAVSIWTGVGMALLAMVYFFRQRAVRLYALRRIR